MGATPTGPTKIEGAEDSVDAELMRLLVYPNSLLAGKNSPLDSYGPHEARRAARMLDIMYRTDGVGLAAPQVGWNVRLFVMNLSGRKGEGEELVLWNPVIETGGALEPVQESCLSFPGVSAAIPRWAWTHVVARSPGGRFERRFEGFGSQAVQHEVDHLDSVLLIERMTAADRRANDRAIMELVGRDDPRKRKK